MRRKTSVFLAGVLSVGLAVSASAAESKLGGLEISGNIDVVTGWQHDDSKGNGTVVGGQLGWFRGSTSPKRDTFGFYLDQFELDLQKTFGDRIRLRADLDFGRLSSGSGRNTDTAAIGSNFEIEQAFVTFDLKGVEILAGRFNVPIGYYLVDRSDNPTISFSNPFNYLTPTNATGAKVYWSHGNFDLHVYAVNNLADSIPFGIPVSGTTANPGGLGNDSAIPSYGTRLGYSWGPEDSKSTIGISYAGGPERPNHNAHLTHIFDLDFALKLTPKLLIAGEGIYRQDNSDVSGIKNDKALGGFVVANYDLKDNWRIFGRYGFLQDRTGFYTGNNQNLHDFALGLGYQLTDGAKMKLEYSPTVFDPRTKGGKTSISHGAALEFAYSF